MAQPEDDHPEAPTGPERLVGAETPVAPPDHYHLAFWIFTGLMLCFGVWLVLGAGLDLVPDEAYYWVWSKHLAWCYYSKGPGIATLIHLGTLLAGDTVLGIRLVALCSSLATGIVLFYWLRRAAGSDRVAFWAVVCLAAAPIMTAGRVLATIDGPLFLCWTLATVLLWGLTASAPRLRVWLLLGLVVGLGTLVKFTMLLFVPAVVAAFLLSRGLRPQWKRPGPWLALGVVALCMLPVFLFNVHHGWITLQHNIEKAGGEKDWGLFGSAAGSLELQMVVISPVLFVLVAWSVISVTRRALRERDRLAAVLAASWLPVFGFYALLAWKKDIAANWPVTGYGAAFAATACLFMGPGVAAWRRRLLVAAVLFAVLVQLPFLVDDVFYRALALAARPGGRLESVARLDQTNRLRGWTQLADRVSAEARKLARDGDSDRIVVLSNSYQYTSEMKFYVRSGFRVGYIPRKTVQDQYCLWPPIELKPGSDAILVSKAPRRARAAFERIEPLEPFVLERCGFPVRKVRLYRAIGFKGWNLQ